MSSRFVLLLALTCGAAVGNLYFPQAVSPLVATGLGLPPATAALVVTAAQAGYAAGIFFLVPLGDRLPPRPLLATLLALTGLSLAVAAVSTSLPQLFGASLLVGLTTVLAPLVAPLAAGLATPAERGRVTGTILSGSIGGMLLSRVLGGGLGEWLGWRAPYALAATTALLLAAVLWRTLPPATPPTRQPYRTLLAETLRLLRTEPALRHSCLNQATVFGAFTAVWTAVALLLTGPAYGHGTQAVGLLALVNAATMLATPHAGRLADRHGPDRVNGACFLLALAAAPVLALGALGGLPGLLALVLGTLVLDVAMQSGMVANQVRIFALSPAHRSRLNTAYMTCAFLGGSLGSLTATALYARLGWPAVCVLVAVLVLAGLAGHRGLSGRRVMLAQ